MNVRLVTVVPVLICISFALTTQGQTAAPSQDKCAIAGTVVDAISGLPLKGADVRLKSMQNASGPQSTSASTDANGHFVFDGLSVGRYVASATRDGYVKNDPWFGDTRSKWLVLGPGQHVNDVIIGLLPDGAIAGHITDEARKPLRGVSVHAMKSSYPRGRRELHDVAHVVTNDAGEYHIPSLTPGKYYVRAKPPASLKAKPGSDKSYVPVLYPAANDISHAVALVLRAGEDLAGIDLNLVPVRTFNLSGRVTNAQTSSPSSEAEVTLLSDQGETVFSPGENFSAHGQANFEFQGVPPGSYVVVAQQPSSPRQPKTMWGWTSVEVKDTNVEHVEVVVSTGVDISGNIRVEGDKAVDLTKEDHQHRGMVGYLELQGPSALAALTPDIDNAMVSADWSFTFREVPQGDYGIRFAPVPEGFYLKSTGVGDVLETGITVSRGHSLPSLDLVLTPGAGRIRGTLEREEHPVAGGLVVLLPDGKGRGQPSDYQDCITDLSGGFHFSNIVPGDYTMFAWEQIDRGAYFDPDFLARFDDRGKAIHIEEDDHLNLKLDAIPPAEAPQ